MQETKRYSVELSSNQIGVIMSALDLWSRLQMGQTGDLSFIYKNRLIQRNSDSPGTLRRISGLCREIRETAFPELNHDEYHSITSPETPDGARTAFDIIQVLRHRLAHDSLAPGEKRGITVNFDEPRRFSGEPLPRIGPAPDDGAADPDM